MKLTLLVLIVLLGFCKVSAHNIGLIEGKVSACDGSPIETYTITLLSVQDSTIIDAAQFSESHFSLSVPDQPFIILISALGYEDLYRLKVDKQTEHLDFCMEKASVLLSEVSVSSIPPVFSVQNDKLVIHASQTTLAQAGSAIDVLRRTAKIKVDEKFGVFVGTDMALIFIDGREVTDTRILDMISSNDVKDVEIITNPSAIYDAKARAIINVITKKGDRKGVSVELTGRLSKAEYWNQYGGAYAKASFDNLSLYTAYSYSPSKKHFRETYGRDATTVILPPAPFPPTTVDIYVQNKLNTTYSTDNDNNFRLGGEYTILQHHKLGTEFSYQSEDERSLNRNKRKVFLATDMSEPWISVDTPLKIVNHKHNNRSVSLYYNYSGPSGFYWTTTLDATNYKNNYGSADSTGIQKEKTKVKNTLKGFRTDMIIPLPGEFKLATGLKHNYIDNTSAYNARGYVSYRNEDKITAAYFILSKHIGKLEVKAGVRAEYTDKYIRTNNSDDVYNMKIDTNYWNLFPNVILDYKLNSKVNISAAYRMSIHRPTFGQLNPAPHYIDELFYMVGNPGLKVETRHNFMLKFNYKKYSLAFGRVKSENGVVDILEGDDDNPLVSRLSSINAKRSEIYTIDLIIPYNNDFMNTFLYTGFIYSRYEDGELGLNLRQPLWYASLSADFKLPAKFELSTNYRYFTKGLFNGFYFKPVFRMDAGLTRKFFDKKLTATFLWNDVFHTDKMKTHTSMGGRAITYNYDYDLSIISIALSYKFQIK